MTSPDPATAAVSASVSSKDEDKLRRRRPGSQPQDESPSVKPSRFVRRSSSIVTDSSVDRMSSSDFFSPRATGQDDELHEDPGLWHSLPLLFAVVPAVGGIFFKRGSVFLTDFTLLILAAIYLNYCLVTPWIWYYNAQTVKIAPQDLPETFLETDVVEEQLQEDDERPDTKSVGEQSSSKDDIPHPNPGEFKGQDIAIKELQLHEVSALTMCFIGPLLGAYLLHVLRSSMSSFGDELISNLHLTLFVLCAEIRPTRHAVKMVQARTLHLQRLVREDPHAAPTSQRQDVDEMKVRLEELQTMVQENKNKEVVSRNSSIPEELIKKQQTALQNQIDALNRAVRRYEKRATAQTYQTEARLQDLETRLRDALSLAAAAASNSNRPGLIVTAFERLSRAFMVPLLAAWGIFVYPFQLAVLMLKRTLFKMGLLQPVQRSRSMARPQGKTKPLKERDRTAYENLKR